MKFSIIIPAHNAAKTIGSCLQSLVYQTFPYHDFEVIVVDDCSTDGTLMLLDEYEPMMANLLTTQTDVCSGPGKARNKAMASAKGEWLVFLDADDVLTPHALDMLSIQIDLCPWCDAVGYGWDWLKDEPRLPPENQRKDGKWIAYKEARISRFLKGQMDGSAIFTAVRNKFDGMRFDEDVRYHEDIGFMWRLYSSDAAITYLDEPIYLKRERGDSITHTISEEHLRDYVTVCERIGIDWKQIIATRLREIIRHGGNDKQRLSEILFQLMPQSFTVDESIYGKVATKFCLHMRGDSGTYREMVSECSAIFEQSWSCKDLQASVFLGPDQVRACCKRFFVDGEQRGDVVLLQSPTSVTLDDIVKAKRELKSAINMGDQTDCSDCPFMEFKEWGEIEPVVNYLSLEHHSLCNLKCTYCSPVYYEGKVPAYDVDELVRQMISDGALKDGHTIVWGGGEPTLTKEFSGLVQTLAYRLPSIKQRILTNAVRHSDLVEQLLHEDRITIVTSVDAGTPLTFQLLRGKNRLHSVMETLQDYAEARAENVTVKYIFTKQNSTMEEVEMFVELCVQHGLMNCNFQISADFTDEHLTEEQVEMIAALHWLLLDRGAEVVFLDDLLRQRLTGAYHFSTTADPHKYQRVVMWGSGQVGKLMVEKSLFFNVAELVYVVDDAGGGLNPEVLLHDDLPVVLAACQGYPELYRRAVALIGKERIIKELIL